MAGQPLTFGLAMRLNGDPTRHFDRAADESAKRGQQWLDEICECGDTRGQHRGDMCFAGFQVGMKQTPCACDEFRPLG